MCFFLNFFSSVEVYMLNNETRRMPAVQSYKGMNELGFHITLLLNKYLNSKTLQPSLPINISDKRKI